MFVNLFFINGIFFSLQPLGIKSVCTRVFLTSVSKDDFFSASVWSIQIKAMAVLWYTVSFKSMVFNVVLTF